MAWKKWRFLLWVLGSYFMLLLVQMFRTEIICLEKLGFFLLLGLVLLRYPKSNHHYFCSTLDGFLSVSVCRCHWWVFWLVFIWRKPTPPLVVACKANWCHGRPLRSGACPPFRDSASFFRLYFASWTSMLSVPSPPFWHIAGDQDLLCLWFLWARWRGVGFFAHLFFSSSSLVLGQLVSWRVHNL